MKVEAVKREFARAMSLKRDGQLSNAASIIEGLVDSYPESAKLLCALAGVYWDMGNLKRATRQFEKAVELAPTLELASLGLFHCLWEQKHQDAAFNEMKRFMAVATSDDYVRIIEELNRDTKTG